MRARRIISAVTLSVLAALSAGPADASCSGRFLNPITEVCWDCIFPISIGSFSFSFGASRPDTSNPGLPVCFCPNPFPRVGLAIGLWEPARLVDVVYEPGCFPNLGIELDLGLLNVGQDTRKTGGEADNDTASFEVHYYFYPLISWLGLVVDGLCFDSTIFDIAYMSELDPIWQDGELTTVLEPESVLFANPVAQLACAADCALASVNHQSSNALFWCDGCQGPMYPMNGDVNAHVGGIQGSLNVATKVQARMHRLLLARGTSGGGALCGSYTLPVIKKTQYRTQLTRPRAKANGYYGCPAIGESTQFYEALREYPIRGESFGWLIWRKRNCCAF